MTFIYIHEDLDLRAWFLDLPSQTLAEFRFGALPDGAHLLTVEAGHPPPDEVLQSFAETVESIIPGGSKNLAMCTRQTGAPLPHYIVLIRPTSGDVVIHYPTLGFTAGIRKDGSKIPPSWRHASDFNLAQRSIILRDAADSLMHEIASRINKSTE